MLTHALPSSSLPTPTSDRPAIDYRAIYHLCREFSWLIGLCFLVALIATATVLARSPRIYAATTVLLVKLEEPKVVNIQQVQQDEYQSLEALKTVEQRLRSKSLVERIIDTNHLADDPRVMPKPGALSREQLVACVGAMIEVHLRRGTRLVDITVQNTYPTLAALIANSLVTEYLKQDYEQGAGSLHTANETLETEAAEVKARLDESENALQAYKEQTHAVSSTDAQNIVLQELNELTGKATDAKSQRIADETAYREVQALNGNIDALLISTAAATSPAIKEIRSNIDKAESDLADLKPRYKPEHPKYLEAESRIAQWQNALRQAALALPVTAKSAFESAQASESALGDALSEQQTVALEMNRKAIRYDTLARDVESNRTLYQTVINQIKDNSVIQDIKASNIQVVEPAEAPEKPVSPDAVKVTLAGLMGGLAASISLVFLMNSLNRSLRTVDETEQFLGVPVLTALPRFSETDTPAARIEAFRTLRASLAMLVSKGGSRVTLFASSLPEEGKTFCAMNYATSLARQGLDTLLIDADLRRPMVEQILRPGRERQPGLTDYLVHSRTFAEVIHPSGTRDLSILTGGTKAPNPVELLARGGFEALVQTALIRFERVVIDSAPLHVVSDTLLLLGPVQATCLVVAANQTPKASVRRAADLLQKAGATLAGVVLNYTVLQPDGYYDAYAYRGRYKEEMETDLAPPEPIEEETVEVTDTPLPDLPEKSIEPDRLPHDANEEEEIEVMDLPPSEPVEKAEKQAAREKERKNA